MKTRAAMAKQRWVLEGSRAYRDLLSGTIWAGGELGASFCWPSSGDGFRTGDDGLDLRNKVRALMRITEHPVEQANNISPASVPSMLWEDGFLFFWP
jgi:hypothetical protein